MNTQAYPGTVMLEEDPANINDRTMVWDILDFIWNLTHGLVGRPPRFAEHARYWSLRDRHRQPAAGLIWPFQLSPAVWPGQPSDPRKIAEAIAAGFDGCAVWIMAGELSATGLVGGYTGLRQPIPHNAFARSLIADLYESTLKLGSGEQFAQVLIHADESAAADYIRRESLGLSGWLIDWSESRPREEEGPEEELPIEDREEDMRGNAAVLRGFILDRCVFRAVTGCLDDNWKLTSRTLWDDLTRNYKTAQKPDSRMLKVAKTLWTYIKHECTWSPGTPEWWAAIDAFTKEKRLRRGMTAGRQSPLPADLTEAT